jgi:hypothetical protein
LSRFFRLLRPLHLEGLLLDYEGLVWELNFLGDRLRLWTFIY